MNVLEKSYLQETFKKSNGIVPSKTHILKHSIVHRMTLKLIIPVQNKKVKSIPNSREKSPEVIFQRSSHIFSFFPTPVSRVSEFTTGISKGTYPRTTCWVAVAVAVRYRAGGAMALFKTTPLSFGKPTYPYF